MSNAERQQLGKPKQIRLPKEVESDLQKIADENGIEFVQAVRLAARLGMPILKKRMGLAVKQAA